MRSRSLLVAISLALAAPITRADVLPPPTRPPWDEHPAPLPTPPEDRGALAVGLALSAVAVAIGAWAARRERSA